MRKSIRPQSRHHLWLYDEDWSYVCSHVSDKAGMTPGAWMREAIHRIVFKLREERLLQREAANKLIDHVEDQQP